MEKHTSNHNTTTTYPSANVHVINSNVATSASITPSAAMSASETHISAGLDAFAHSSAVSIAGNPSAAGSSNGAKYKLMSPAQLPISRSSPRLTVPSPMFSPSSFLESPVLLSNIKAEPSPTTGSFFKHHQMHEPSTEAAFSFGTSNLSSRISDDGYSSSFEFQIHAVAGSASGLSPTSPSNSTGLKQLQREEIRQEYNQLLARAVVPVTLSKSEMSVPNESGPSIHISTHAPLVNAASPSEPEEITKQDHQSNCNQVPHSDIRDAISSSMSERSSGDGYNWRKYGQKLVKGSEFPRSYYKCTFPNCEVKKIFECSPDGHITEIVYKGSHDHPRPQPSRRFTPGVLMSIQEEKVDKDSSVNGEEDNFNRNGLLRSNSDPNGMNVPSPRQVVDGPECATDEIDNEDPYSKRRKIDDSFDITPIIKPIREPRVVVQTLSEVDILDDGYRWRKYGQKVVRGNPNPRSYYKCTFVGCPVRKHVERASHDPKAVITTYEGKHNHDVPTAKSSNHGLFPSVNGIPPVMSRDNDSVSLNLEVGINRDTDNRSNGQLVGRGNVQNQTSMASSGMMGAQTAQLSVLLGQQHTKFLNAMGL
ncbi:DNA-binding transcription factor [Lithospermum erythrorhizon]|uniref:DNA-binding transcription factor n=1 Tax=Lithospermum erythrorhizon TaxID=34254 RepID=A0AAV3P028_LITER